MDAAVATLLGATIAGLTSIVTVFLTNWFNLRQTNANLQSRLTEVAFSSRLEAYASFAEAMNSVQTAVFRIAWEVNEHTESGNVQPTGDARIDAELVSLLNSSMSQYMNIYFRTRMYLTPDMDAISRDISRVAGAFLNVPEDFTVRQAQRKFVFASTDVVDIRQALKEPESGDIVACLLKLEKAVDGLTTEMRKYVASVQQVNL
jgi:hypothetical protein